MYLYALYVHLEDPEISREKEKEKKKENQAISPINCLHIDSILFFFCDNSSKNRGLAIPHSVPVCTNVLLSLISPKSQNNVHRQCIFVTPR